MKYVTFNLRNILVVLAASLFIVGAAQAGPPEHAGGGKDKGNKGGKVKVEQSHNVKIKNKGHSSKGSGSTGIKHFFDDDKRSIIRDFYSSEFKRGNCPPGLAKKNNGCLPPGQAKKWQVGHRLPGDVIYHDLPGDLLRRLGHNDPAYKLIRVGTDILKIGVGTGLVVEAVEDLGDIF